MRTLHALLQLIKLVESVEICRHVSICRYFGEKIDHNDKEIVNRYCGGKCDVRPRSSSNAPILIIADD